MRPVFEWNIGSRVIQLGKRTLVVGVLNVTPDSFSDGGQHADHDSAVQHGLKMIEDGADIIDVGGESTRPGAKAVVSEKDEAERIVGVIKSLKEKHSDCLISVDTYKAAVARAAFNSGAEIVNDVSGFRWDPAMKKTLSELKCGAVLMHSRGRPEEWAKLKPVPDIVTLVKRELREWADAAQIAGMKRDRILLDPGFGFGKNLEENYPLLKRFEEFHQLRYPLMVGVSRKSFIGHAIARNGTDAPLGERLHGTLGAEVAAILKGAHVIRTHDVRACVETAKLADVAAI
ncbi:MAG TPA: dihydropteroate synthase [Terriglobales bacterium]|nr:dihydropteroate synthase [Terriglobales bacterium]